jgi:hypothetical protein
VDEEEAHKADDAKPECGRGENPEGNGHQVAQATDLNMADRFHPFAQQDVAERTQQDTDENQRNSFEVQSSGVLFVVVQMSVEIDLSKSGGTESPQAFYAKSEDRQRMAE